jgi:hypothetical protein
MTVSGEAMSTSWRPFPWLMSDVRGRLVLAVLMLQVLVPLVAFMAEPPTRFGFQMYSGLGGTTVEAQGIAGEPIDVDLSKLLAGTMRPELDWMAGLPEHVCANVESAATVTVEQSTRQRTVTCD